MTATATAKRLIPALAGSSPAMRDLVRHVDGLAARPETVGLLMGEAGVGKGRIAELIHERSPRSRRKFATVTCMDPDTQDALLALDDTAPRRRAGGGTLFLSEISHLTGPAQRVLTGWLADAEFQTNGPRLLASTSRDLVELVTEGYFAEDLYYRLAVMPINIPPLRARAPEDVVDLIEAVVRELSFEVPGAPSRLEPAVLERLARQPWPGNLRQLRNLLEWAAIAARGAEQVEWDHLPAEIRDPFGADIDYVPRTIGEVERLQIERALRAHRHNRTRAAAALGISRATLIKKIREFGLGPRPRRG